MLASNFSGTWPGLVALLNTGASLESVGRHASRIWTDAADWTANRASWNGSTMVFHRSNRPRLNAKSMRPRPSAESAQTLADGVFEQIRRKRILALMLGDTSMGMINGYFGPRLLYPIGFAEHKVDQSWLDRPRQVD